MEETAYTGAQLHTKTQQQTTLPVALLHLLQTEFNGISRQALEHWKRVNWPYFERLRRDLATGNFRSESIALQGDFMPQAPVSRPSSE